MMRKLYLYIAVSAAVHLGFFFFLWLAKAPQQQDIQERRVVIEFSQSALKSLQDSPSRAATLQTPARPLPNILSADPATSSPGMLPLPKLNPAAAGTYGTAAATRHGELARISRVEKPVLPGIVAVAAIPSFGEVILDTLAETGSGDSAAAAASALAGNGYAPQSALEWKGRERKLLRRPEIKFPDPLLEKGLEADVEAFFTVVPSGQVIKVEISRSSGFTMVDSAVEKALLNYLFEESAGGGEDLGRIAFHFRLERRR